MRLTANIGNYSALLEDPIDISIPVRFDAPQLSAFGGPPATRAPYATSGFVGDVRKGGSCNCDVYTFSPHLNGTHTECIGHLTKERISIHDMATENLIPATLVSVEPAEARCAVDTYSPLLRPRDMIVTKQSMAQALDGIDPVFLGALIVRTLPNDESKRTRDYAQEPPPFFSIEAMREIVARGVRHLLTDMPSIDRPDDEGLLTCHRLFWNLPKGATESMEKPRKTITELIYAPPEVSDGVYLLNLQVAAFAADAAPSRPVLYKVYKR